MGSILGLGRNPPWVWDWESGWEASFSVDLVRLGDTDNSVGEVDLLGLNRDVGFLRSLSTWRGNARIKQSAMSSRKHKRLRHVPRCTGVLDKQAGKLRLGHHRKLRIHPTNITFPVRVLSGVGS